MAERDSQEWLRDQINKTVDYPERGFIPSAQIDIVNKLGLEISEALQGFSKTKKKTGKGYPDYMYFNQENNLLIIGEVKGSVIKQGKFKSENEFSDADISDTAIGGLIHYMKAFRRKQKYQIYGIAFSGSKDNFQLDTFIINKKNQFISKNIHDFSNEKEDDYLQVFKTDSTEYDQNIVKNYANDINQLMFNIPTNDRALLLSGIIIGLYKNPHWKNKKIGWVRRQLDLDNQINASDIKRNIFEDVKSNLENSEISQTKASEFKKIIQPTLINSDALDILEELTWNIYQVIKIFEKEHMYDLMGSFYNTFLNYTKDTNGQDLGIVLTPTHITDLMVEILHIYSGGIGKDDVVLDPCCGSGGFLISFMNFQTNKYAKDNPALQDKIKSENLRGIELNKNMWVLAMANMLLRGDGKSNIKLANFFTANGFTKNNQNIARFGLMNPPYSQAKKNKAQNKVKKTTTKSINLSEMSFIERLCSKVDGFVAVIVPKPALFKNDESYRDPKNNLYKKNTLKCVIGMPNDLFYGKGIHTCIAVFDTHKGQNKDDEVYFYDLKWDGFVTSNKDRHDSIGKWKQIKKELLNSIKNRKEIKNKSILVNNLSVNDEWIPEAWLPTDYSNLMSEDADQLFDKVIKEYTLFKYKEATGILDNILDANNEPNREIKKEKQDKIPADLDLLEMIQKEGLNALEIIEGADQSDD